MAYKGFNRVGIELFEEQTVSDNTTYYTDTMSMDVYESLHLQITSSGTVDGVFTLQTRSRPIPAAGVWENDDDGYWFNESTTISGAQGHGDKQNDSVNLTNVNCSQYRLKMDIISGGVLGVWTTIK